MTANYQYTESGLSNIYLVNGFEQEHFDGDIYTTVKESAALNKAIGSKLINKTSILSGQELRYLRKQCRLSQKELAGFLGVTDKTLNDWEQEKSEQTQGQDAFVRLLYIDYVGLNKRLSDVLERFKLDAVKDKDQAYKLEKGKWALCEASI